MDFKIEGIKPCYEEEAGVIYCGDCLEIMPKIPDKSVDLVWTDPPYNVGKDYGIYKDNLSDREYLEWLEKVILELKRVARAVCIFIPHKYALECWSMLGSYYRQIILPYVPEGVFRFGFINQFSFLLTDAKPLKPCKNVWYNVQLPGLGYFFKENNCGHPGYTSEDLTARVINYFSLENQIILDPFSGSGTTGKICKRTNRRFIQVDINPDYCETAKQRLAQEVMNLSG